MKTFARLILLLLLCVSMFTIQSEACTCRMPTIETQFCSSNAVIRAKITGVTEEGWMNRYDIDIKGIYK